MVSFLFELSLDRFVRDVVIGVNTDVAMQACAIFVECGLLTGVPALPWGHGKS